ncbi:flagellar filament capping protein FliD [Sphingomonas radiodurans]|uniref:flagellar filament capping protein FliD n=1 Tax=Sphingomonas radiodurans TaxID=2890321 RepID=UPI001E283588|nr:flagellar filament capping protein FliD [Sphingomonas radiodurans]WBH15682.1 flagellar filament capping protein FliD [Sphingomonas radiodurans]
MATITSTTTPTPTTTSVTKSAASALLTSLDTGSGVDTDALVTGLVEAQFAAKTATLTAKSEKLTTQLSGVSTLKSAISDFASALEALVKGGSLQSQPASSNNAVLTATALSGAKLTGLTGSIRVDRLATAQTAVSNASVATKDTVLGTGTLTLKLGTATYDTDGAWTGVTGTDADGDGAEDTISIDVTTGSLTDIAAAINAKKAGVTASVVTDADGKAFLSLKGETGTAKAFTLTADDPDSALSQVNVGPGASGMNLTSTAGNAKLTVDGIPVERASNSVTDLVAGVKLDLVGTSTTAVTLSSSAPTTALTNAVEDVVFTYNTVMAELKKQTDPITGELRGDSGAQNLLRSLKGLTTRDLLPGAAPGTPRTLAELGVNTNRDGTLSVNSDTLTKVIASNPAALEAIFSNSSDGSGLMAAMNSVKLNATSTLYGLGASTTRYNQSKSDLTDQQDKIAEQREKLTTRMTQQFASMNARVAAYKSTMTFMENQIKQWTNGDN